VGDLAGCPVFEVATGEPYFEASSRDAVLLAVVRGFVVMRSTPVGLGRSIVTCDAYALEGGSSRGRNALVPRW
jgi:hypothetical protein